MSEVKRFDVPSMRSLIQGEQAVMGYEVVLASDYDALAAKLTMAEDAAAKGDAARQQCGGMEMEIEELRAELAELRARVVVVPDGYALVPVEPLLNMMSDKDHDTRITAERQLLSILAAAPGKEVPQAWIDVQEERRRQITAEGWTPEHDDLYCAAELPRAAAAYILNGANDEAPAIWPFVAKWWKPRDARSNYVRAGALILAEIERLDRAAHGKEVGHE